MKHFSFERIRWEIITNLLQLYENYQLSLSDFTEIWIFSSELQKQIQKLSKYNLVKFSPMLPFQYNLSLKSKHLQLINSLPQFRRIQNLTPVFTIQSLPLIMRQKNPCHFLLLHIFFGSILVSFYSHKIPCVNIHTKFFWQEVWMGTWTLKYVSQV